MNRLPLTAFATDADGQVPVPPWTCMRCTAGSNPCVSTVTVAVLPLSWTVAVPLPVTWLVGTACSFALNPGAFDEPPEATAMTTAIAPPMTTSAASAGHHLRPGRPGGAGPPGAAAAGGTVAPGGVVAGGIVPEGGAVPDGGAGPGGGGGPGGGAVPGGGGAPGGG